jgi:hypothetical protein
VRLRTTCTSYLRANRTSWATPKRHYRSQLNYAGHAFEAATDGDPRHAASLLSVAANGVESAREQGWLLEQKAAYLDLVAPVEAQQTLAATRQKNSMVLRPLSGLTYQRLSASADQAQQAADFLSDRYGSGVELRLGLQSIANDLAFDPESTEEAEEALRQVALHIGIGGERPEKEWGSGPDVLWVLGGLNYWAMEAKTGAVTDEIHKRDANQLAGSMHWFQDRYDATAAAVPVMVHPARRLARDATPTPNMCVLTEEGVNRLREALVAFGAGLAGARWDDRDTVNGQLAGHRHHAADLPGYLRAAKPGRAAQLPVDLGQLGPDPPGVGGDCPIARPGRKTQAHRIPSHARPTVATGPGHPLKRLLSSGND